LREDVVGTGQQLHVWRSSKDANAINARSEESTDNLALWCGLSSKNSLTISKHWG
jgi:hypothetical protein